ncbi:MAG: hypothetical protein ACMXYK_00340 [Candidatus Woesearchaeota archaeon]
MELKEIVENGNLAIDVIRNGRTIKIRQEPEKDCMMLSMQEENKEPLYFGCAHSGTYSPEDAMRNKARELLYR